MFKTNKPKIYILMMACLVSIVFCSCFMRTYTGGGGYYPPGTTYSDSKYRYSATFLGAYRRAFTDETKKTIGVQIYEDKGKETDREMFRDVFYVVASHLQCDVQWDKFESIEVEFFDYGENLYETDAKKMNKPKRHILTVKYAYDRDNDVFVETWRSDQ